MTRILEIVTPEQVPIRYELSGLGSRGIALLIDTFFQVLILLAVVGIAALVFGAIPNLNEWYQDLSDSIRISLLLLAVFLITWGYAITFETLWNGETPGKRWMGLRVIKDGGYPIDFRAAVVRNLLRIVDVLPGVPVLPIYGFGFVAILCHAQYKRLGDMAAGTLVVRHGQEEERFKAELGKVVVLRVLDATVTSQLHRLTRDEYRLVQRYLDRRDDIPIAIRGEFAQRLAMPLMSKFAYQIPDTGVDYDRWLEELDQAYRDRTLGVMATPTPTPAPTTPEPPSLPLDGRKW